MRKFLWPLFLFLLASSALAVIFEPQDKNKYFSEIIYLRGQIEGAGELAVNDQPLKINPDRTFFCGLVLKSGKNLVEVKRNEQQQRIRLLRLVSFPDIEQLYEGKKHWAESQIVYLATLGIIEGNPDGNFYPGNAVSRGEFATWLARLKKLSVPQLTEDAFPDVPKEHWRAGFIKAAVAAGYLKPFANGNLGLDDPISRREAAEITVASEGLGIIEKIKPLFVDVPQQERGAVPIYTAQESGLVIGVSKDIPIYDPERALTRAEAAMLLSRFYTAQEGFRNLVDFEMGYTAAQYCGLDVAPEISYFTVEPAEIPSRQATTIKLRAQLSPRGKFYPVSKVKADLSELGGMPDAELFDDGTHGDEESGDSVFSLNASFTPAESSEKTILLTAIDRLGWEGKATAAITVTE
jgi:hypothetical protein